MRLIILFSCLGILWVNFFCNIYALGVAWSHTMAKNVKCWWGRSSSFGDEPKTHPLPLHKDFRAPFFAPKFSPPTYQPPPLLPPSVLHLIFCSLHLKSLGKLLSLNSTELQGDVRHKAWGRWRAQCWRNVERKRQEECFIPNAEAREER